MDNYVSEYKTISIPTIVTKEKFSHHQEYFVMYGERIYNTSPILKPYKPQNMQNFLDKYEIIKRIYSSQLAYSEIILLQDKEENKFAAKRIKKQKLSADYLHDFVRNEMAIQHSLSNFSQNGEFIVKVEDYYEDENYYLMVMEFSQSPDYFEQRLENSYNPITNERKLKLYATDMLSAICEVHRNNIIHCDIKPQNFLKFRKEMSTLWNEDPQMESEDDDTWGSIVPIKNDELKITDFGLAHLISGNNNKVYMKYRAGTYEYKAPEVKDNSYVDKSIDIWSFGISLYKMAACYFPTAIGGYKYGSGPIPFRKNEWKYFEGKDLIQDLIRQCLHIDPYKRITAEEALNHPWFYADQIVL